MTYQLPYTFSNATTVDASQVDANNQYLLGLIQAGNTVVSILHSQVSDWTSAVQQTVAQYVSSSDGSVNISIINGLLNFQALPTNSSVESIILSYLTNTDGSVTFNNAGGQLILSSNPTITHNKVSDWTSAVQNVITSFIQPGDSSLTFSLGGGTLNLTANPGPMSHTNITDWTSSVQASINSYLQSNSSSIYLVSTGGATPELTLNYTQQSITSSLVSDFVSAVQGTVLSYITPSNDGSIILTSSGNNLQFQSITLPQNHTIITDWTPAIQSLIQNYLVSNDGSISISNTGNNLNLKSLFPSTVHTNITDWTSAVQNTVQNFITSDGTIGITAYNNQLILHGIQQPQVHTIITDWTSAVQNVVSSFLQCTDGSLTLTNSGGVLNLKVPTPSINHTNVSDWSTAIQSAVTTILESSDGSVVFSTVGGNLNLHVPLQSLVHTDITDWNSSVQSVVQNFLTSSNNTVTFVPNGGQLNLAVPPPVIPHGNVSDWTSAVQSTVAAYLTSSNGSITINSISGALNLSAVPPNISHNNITDWTSAVTTQVTSFLKNNDGTITLVPSGGNLILSAVFPSINHTQVSDWTSAVQSTIGSYLTNSDGTITYTNQAGQLNIRAVIPSSIPHTNVSDWTGAVQNTVQSYLTSDGTVTYTVTGGQLSLHANTSTFPSSETHTYISDWNTAVQGVVSTYLTNSDGSIHITNTGSALNLTAPTPALVHTNISDFTTATQNVVQSFLTSSNGSVIFNLTSGGQLNLQATGGSGGSFPSAEPHTYISDWTSAVQNTVASYLVSTNGTINFNNSGGQLNLSATIPTTFTHTNITDFTSATQSVIAGYLTTDSTISISNTGSALSFHVPIPSLTHNNISDFSSATQAVISSYITSSNGSITFTLTGGQLNMQTAGSQGNTLTHSSITDWTSALNSGVQAYLTSSPSQITFTPTSGGQLSLGLASNLTHGIISDWSPSIQASVTSLITSNPATGQSALAITTSGANLNIVSPQQSHTWITDWNSAVLASLQAMLISSNNSITFTTVGSQLSLQVASSTQTTGATISTNPATLSVVSGSPAGTQIAALSTTGFAGPYTYTITAINGVSPPNTQFVISGSNLVCGNTATDNSVAATETVTIQSTSGSNSTSATFTISITAQSTQSSTTPYFDMNFVTGTYTGTTLSGGLSVSQGNVTFANTATAGLAQIAPNTPRVTSGSSGSGLFIDPSILYIGQYDCTPANWGYSPYSVGQTHYANVSSATPLAQAGMFYPVTFVFSENTGSRLVPGIINPSVNARAGQVITVNLIVQPSSGNGTEGLKVQFEWLTGNGANFNYAEIAWENLLSGWDGGTNSGGTRSYLQQNNWQMITCPVIREIQPGVFNIVLQHTVQGDGTANNFTVSVAPHSGSGGTITFWGMSVSQGLSNGWAGGFGQMTTVQNQFPADVVTLTGPCAVPLSSAAGAICIEMAPTFYLTNGASNGQLLKVGSTDVLSLYRTTAVQTNSGQTTTACGFGGLQGISRIMFTFDNTGYSVCMNGGAVQRSTTVLNLSGVQQLCTTLSGNIRRITGWIGRQTDSFIQTTTQCYNVVFPNYQNALNLDSSTRTFWDDFTSNSIAPWVGSPTWPGGSSQGTINNYVGANGNTGTGTGQYNWIPRMAPAAQYFATGGCLGVSGNSPGPSMEYEWYIDPNFNWGSSGYSQIAIANSNCTITATALANLPSSVQSIFNAGGSGTNNVPGHYGGGPQQFASGTINTCGMFQQQFGYFECRMKVPSIGACWPAFWIMPGSQAGFGSTVYELDVLEMFGQKNVSGQQYTASSAYTNIHWNNYGNNSNGVGPLVGPPCEFGGTSPNSMGSPCNTSWNNVALTPDFAQDFNTFGMLWRNGFIETFFNGGFVSYTNTSGFTGFTMNNSGPGYMILNLAVGGSSGTGSPVGNENGSQMVIDWVAAYA